MKYCPHCNTPLPKHTRICPDCGRPVRGGSNRDDEKGSSNTGGCVKLMPIILVVFLAAICMLAFTVTSLISKRHRRTECDPSSVADGKLPVYTTVPQETKPFPEQTVTTPNFFSDIDMPFEEEQNDASVSVEDYAFTEDVFGHKILTVNLLFTNEGDTPTSFFRNFRTDAFQDGASCTVTVTDFDLVQNETRDVQSGKSLIIPQSFIVKPDQDIDLTVSTMGFEHKVVLEQTIPHP